jgi:hypothetical protein
MIHRESMFHKKNPKKERGIEKKGKEKNSWVKKSKKNKTSFFSCIWLICSACSRHVIVTQLKENSMELVFFL